MRGVKHLSVAAVLAAAAVQQISPAEAQSVQELRNLSIEDLANVEVTSVSKTSERLSDAAAAVYVISHDDIIRSGATTIPEMLRLAPNLEVAQINASTYAISARGFTSPTTRACPTSYSSSSTGARSIRPSLPANIGT